MRKCSTTLQGPPDILPLITTEAFPPSETAMQPTRFPTSAARPGGSGGAGYTTTHHPNNHTSRPDAMQHPSSALAGSNASSSSSAATQPSTSTSTSASSSASAQPVTRGIELGGWKISVTSGPIGSSAEMDALGEILGIPPPEMAFPHNCLSLHHADSGFSLCFDAVRTLRSVDGVREQNRLHGINCRDPSSSSSSTSNTKKTSTLKSKPKPKPKSSIKVAYAKEWGKSRNEYPTTVPPPSSSTAAGSDESMSNANTSTSHFGADVAKKVFAQQQKQDGQDESAASADATTSGIAAAKDYDWTYSTTWAGSVGDTSPQPLLSDTSAPASTAASTPSSAISGLARDWFVPGTDPSRDRIPVERLGPSSGEPILFYDDIVLFEDELADNGSSMVNVKVRVMPSGFLVLQRFFLRVDDVLFRVFDTRLYCQFSEGTRPGHSVPTSIPAKTGMPNATMANTQRTTNTATSADQIPANLSSLSLGATRSAAKRATGPQAHTALASNDTDVEMGSSNTARHASGTGLPDTPDSEEDLTSYPRLIRECSGCEAPYSEVRKHLPAYKPNDLSPFTDVQWVSSTLTKISQYKAASYHAAVASGNRLPLLSDLNARTPPKFEARTTAGSAPGLLGAQRGAFGFAGNRPGEKVDLSPAKLHTSNDTPTESSAQILGELPTHRHEGEQEGDDDDDDTWIGIGARVDVAVLRP